MHWGRSLLFGISDLGDILLDALASMLNTLSNLFNNLLYGIWSLIALIVDGVEKVFRKLAGLDVADGEDLVSKIVNNSAVDIIFKNLVSFATALMIVFTIVKILQDHYKEKDGGNPYKTCLRTFKGMLMFFFVGIAVSVGLYATGVVFRGLDSATSGDAASIGGQVFKAMAADANRLSKGRPDDDLINRIATKHWARMSPEGGVEDGKYALVQMTTDKSGPTTAAELQEAYKRICPEYKYGIVNKDGSVSPIAPYLKSLAAQGEEGSVKEELKDKWGEMIGGVYSEEELKEVNKWENNIDEGSVEGSAGYKNDILSAVTLNITPSIDLTWSPIDIMNYTYEIMSDGEPITWDINITALGTGFNISFMIEKVKFWKTAETQKSMEDSAKQFGITMQAQAGMQDGKLSANFSLDMFNPQMFMDLLASVIVNNGYTWLMMKLVESLPSMYVVFSVSGISVNLLQLFSPIVLEFTQVLIDNTVGHLIPTAKEPDPDNEGELIEIYDDVLDDEGNPTGEKEKRKMVVPFYYASSGKDTYGRGVWVNINDKSTNMPIVIERYLFDPNFEDLWSQLTDNWNNFTNQLDQATTATYEQYSEAQAAIDEQNRRVANQSDWKTYYSLVEEYNKIALSSLNELGSLLSIYEQVKYHDELNTKESIEVANEILAKGTSTIKGPLYEGTLAELKSEIKEIFVDLVTSYNGSVGSKANRKPSSTYADAIITQSVYKPIVELKYSDRGADAASVTASYIYDLFMNPNSENKDKIKFNMLVEAGNGSAYATRQIDWDAYGPEYEKEFKNVADLYFDGTFRDSVGDTNANTLTKKQTTDQMKVINYTNWVNVEPGSRCGAQYFFSKAETPLKMNFTGKGNIVNKQGFWGNRGLTVNDGKVNYRYYQAYQGTAKNNSDKNNHWGPKGPTYIGSSIESSSVPVNTSNVSLSSAQSNANLAEGIAQSKKEISVLTDVEEEKSELATEFAKEIITFRKLDTAEDEKPTDKQALKSWVKQDPVAGFTGEDFDTYMLFEMDPARIDNLMAAGPGQRNYLMKTKDGMSGPDANNNFGSYVGFFSYTNLRTVNALYDLGDINFIVGFIALVSALGVYLNFAFGLIKRAVNMAVLYIMSPISIAFYPFDDGSKFNQQFVSPFYKEAISAFAVIISLNIFMLLLNPVQTAVKNLIGPVFSWIALVAFVSMLPGIRDTICSVLGAAKMESKGLGQMIDDAANSLSSPFKGLKSNTVANAKKKIGDLKTKVKDGVDAFGKATGLSDKLAGLKKKVGDSGFGKKMKALKGRLDNTGVGKAASKVGKAASTTWGALTGRMSEKKINDAIAKGDKSGLSPWERIRYNKLQKKAKEALGDGADDAAIKAKMADKEFQKSVPSVMKTVTSLRNKALKGAAAFAIAGPAGLALALGPTVGNIKDGIAKKVQDAAFNMRGTVAGELLHDFVESKKADKNSGWGRRFHRVDEASKAERMKKIAGDHIKEEDRRREAEKDAKTGFGRGGDNKAKGNGVLGEAAEMQLDEMSKRDTVAEMAAEIAKKNNKESDQAYIEQVKNDLYNGGTVHGYSLDSDDGKARFKKFKAKNEIHRDAILQELQELAQEGSQSLKVKLDGEITGASFSKEVSNGMIEALKFDNAEDKKKAEELVEKNKNADKEQLAEIFKAEFEGKTDKDGNKITSELITAAIESQAGNIKNMQDPDAYTAKLQVALKAAEFFETGEKLLKQKVGDLVSPEALQELSQAYANLLDKNINSANKDSLGAAYRRIEADPQYTTDAARAAAKEEAYKAMQARVDQLDKEFMRNEGMNIRKYKVTKDLRENVAHAQAMHMVNAGWEQIEYQLNVATDQAVRQMIVNDGLFQNMTTNGDPVEGALKMQKVAYAVKTGDMDTAYSLGMDKETVDKLFEYKNTGKGEYIDQVSNLAGTFSSFLGSMDHAMGGESIAGAMSALTNTFQVAMSKQLVDTLSTAANAAGAEEGRANESITQFLSELNTMCNSKNWKQSFSKGMITTLDGAVIKSTQEMREVLDGLVNDIRTGKKSYNSSEVTHFMDMITQVRDEYPEDKTIFEETKDMLNAFAKANVQHNKGKEYFEKNTLVARYNASIHEKTAKMTDRK